VVGNGNRPTTLSWNPAADGIRLVHHSAAAADFMPPRSLQVFVIE
jgi:hypothetical protein